MIARISTTLNCTDDELWEKVMQPATWKFISNPLLRIEASDELTLDDEWKTNKPYRFRIYLFRVIPLGNHTIKLIEIDKSNNLIRSRETGTMAKTWNHIISFETIDDEYVRYTDEIDIKSGILTIPIWLFANIFYRHRQRRWKKLLKTTTPDT